jgi:hypothetical protein
MDVPTALVNELAKIPFVSWWQSSYTKLRMSRDLTKANLRREIFDFILAYPGVDVHYVSVDERHPAVYALFYFEASIGDIPIAYITNPGMQMVALFDNGTKIKNKSNDKPIIPNSPMHVVNDKDGHLVLVCS